MKTFISVECNRCRTEIKQTEPVYCSGCVDDKVSEIGSQDRHIEWLNDELKIRQEFINSLLKIINKPKEKN